MRRALGVLAAVVSLTVFASCSSNAVSEGDFHGAVLTTPYVVPDVALTDTDGASFSLAADTDKRLTLVFFGYTHCPDTCQVVMSSIASALTRLDEADRDQVDVVFVTTDPARDNETVLRGYLDQFDPTFLGLTGEIDTIAVIASPMGVAIEDGIKLPTGGYEVAHSTQVIAVDSDNRSPMVWTEGTSAAEFADDIHLLLDNGN